MQLSCPSSRRGQDRSDSNHNRESVLMGADSKTQRGSDNMTNVLSLLSSRTFFVFWRARIKSVLTIVFTNHHHVRAGPHPAWFHHGGMLRLPQTGYPVVFFSGSPRTKTRSGLAGQHQVLLTCRLDRSSSYVSRSPSRPVSRPVCEGTQLGSTPKQGRCCVVHACSFAHELRQRATSRTR